MPDLLQITMPVLPKNYVNPSSKISVQNDAIFDLVDLSKVIKTSDRSEQTTQDNSAFEGSGINSPKTSVLISKDPSYAAASLKALLGNDTLALLNDSNNIELAAKLTELANEIMLSPKDVVTDLLKQQLSSTIFNGDFFDILRQICGQTANTNLKNSIAMLLKNISGASSSQEVLNSIASNLRFLSEEISPNKSLSDQLFKLSEQFISADADKNFGYLKGLTQNLLNDVSKSLLLNDKMRNIMPLITYNLSRFQDNPSSIIDSFRNILEFISSQSLKDSLQNSFKQVIENSNMSAEMKFGIMGGSSSVQSELSLKNLIVSLADSSNLYCKNMNPDYLSGILSSIDTSKELLSLKNIFSQVLPDSCEAQLNTFLNNFKENSDLNSLLSRLSSFLARTERMDVKVLLTQSLNEVLNQLAEKQGVSYNPPSSMENLATFLSKNINDSALRSMNLFNQQAAIQSLLTAPGVFTPLCHYLIPLQWQETRAFGELWVDNNASGSAEYDSNENHLLLAFSVENVGDFELEIYTKNTDLSMNLLCPEDFTGGFAKIKDHITRIVAGNGYTPRDMKIAALKEKRNIIDVFPRIKEKRSGLNVTI